jgi:hypothetical protein
VNGENSLKICLWQNTGCILLCTESVYWEETSFCFVFLSICIFI